MITHEAEQEDSFWSSGMAAGEDMALISDAGTPLISNRVITWYAQAREAGVRVMPIPGACAPDCRVSAAAAVDRFAF